MGDAPADIAAKALEIDAADVLSTRYEPSGDLIAVTTGGEKVRITTDGELQFLVGPRSQPDVFEPPAPAEAEAGDLPPLEETPADAPETPAGDEPTSSGDSFEVFKGEDKQWYIRQVAANGEEVMVSEAHKRLKDAMEEAARLAEGREVRKV